MQGFWISPKFKITKVVDHLMAVGDKPGMFEISVDAFADMVRRGFPREAILINVLKNGWVRVRGHGQYMTFEGWGRNDDIISAALIFAKYYKMWDNDVVIINNLKSGRAIEITLGELNGRYGARKNPRIRFIRRILIRG
ncbi:MAG: hypothetical protein V1701_02770 [Planctomycetota bacterium]